MARKKYIHWKDDSMWLGYFEEYPDYMTQGETFEELKDNLRDIYTDLSNGKIPYVRKVALLGVGLKSLKLNLKKGRQNERISDN